MNLNKLSIFWVFLAILNTHSAEQSTESTKLKITNFFKTSKHKADKDPKLASLPIQVKPKLGMALFSGKEINLFLASAIMNMQPHSQALMSVYEASYLDIKHSHNPLLQALYCQHQESMGLDTQVISNHKNLVPGKEFFLFNKFLKKIGCQVNVFDPLKSRENGLTICQNPCYGALHHKFYVFDKCLPNDTSPQKSSLAVITSHNPTKAAFEADQQNDALVIALPSVINQLKERFQFIKVQSTEDFAESVEDFSCGFSKEDRDFESSDFSGLHLQKTDSDQVELLASPMRAIDQSIIKKIVAEIDKESECVQAATFQFSHADVVQALINALERGVRVECVLNPLCLLTNSVDGGNVHNLAVSRLQDAIRKNNNNGFVKADSSKFLHHKFYTFKGRQTVITGSLNCTGNSEKNCAEVNVKIADQENFRAYYDHFMKLAAEAKIVQLPNKESVHKRLIAGGNYSYSINGWTP
jgi:hypothetical protein